MKTLFANDTNPWTGKKEIEFVPIPQLNARNKGRTAHDDMFNRMIKDKVAVSISDLKFSALRRTAQRFMANNGLKGKLSLRQRKEGRSYTMWFEVK
jgi:hypothetical protein